METCNLPHFGLVILLLCCCSCRSSLVDGQHEECHCSQWCSCPLGLQDGFVKDDQLSASSYIQYFYTRGRTHHMKAKYGRLNGTLAWCGYSYGDVHFDVDLNSVTLVSGISTQGYDNNWYHYYIKNYNVLTSNDTKEWKRVKPAVNSEHFQGNVDGHNIVHNKFEPVMTRYLRLAPLSYHVRVCLRMELYGCRSGDSNNSILCAPKLATTPAPTDGPSPTNQTTPIPSPTSTKGYSVSSTPSSPHIDDRDIMYSTYPDGQSFKSQHIIEENNSEYFGTVIGVALSVALVVLLVGFWMYRRRRRRSHSHLEYSGSDSLVGDDCHVCPVDNTAQEV